MGCQDPKELHPSLLCSYIMAFRNLEYPWIQDKEIRENFFQKCVHFYENQGKLLPGELRDFSTIIHQFGKNGVKLKVLPSETINAFYNGLDYFLDSIDQLSLSSIITGYVLFLSSSHHSFLIIKILLID